MTVHLVRRGEALDDLLGDPRGIGGVADVAQEYREFVAAEACHGVGLPDALTESSRRFAQQAIADRVTESVIDVLEAIEIHEQQGGMLSSRAVRRSVHQLGHEILAVGQLGQQVVVGAFLDVCLGAFDVGDVGVDADDIAIGGAVLGHAHDATAGRLEFERFARVPMPGDAFRHPVRATGRIRDQTLRVHAFDQFFERNTESQQGREVGCDVDHALVEQLEAIVVIPQRVAFADRFDGIDQILAALAQCRFAAGARAERARERLFLAQACPGEAQHGEGEAQRDQTNDTHQARRRGMPAATRTRGDLPGALGQSDLGEQGRIVEHSGVTEKDATGDAIAFTAAQGVLERGIVVQADGGIDPFGIDDGRHHAPQAAVTVGVASEDGMTGEQGVTTALDQGVWAGQDHLPLGDRALHAGMLGR